MCGSILADLFPPESRGLANGIFSWGVGTRHPLKLQLIQSGLLGIRVGLPSGHPGEQSHHIKWAHSLPTQGTQLDMLGYGWRAPYVLAALPGLLTAALIILTLKEPARQAATTAASSNNEGRGCVSTLRLLSSPALLLLLLAAMARWFCKTFVRKAIEKAQ